MLYEVITENASSAVRDAAKQAAAELHRRDHLFPDILPAVERALEASGATALIAETIVGWSRGLPVVAVLAIV